jgi:2-C-methyl-D-erythritol 4-phosphate cytidylyltransferase/2-C-methyl-D-erythritol 2,4-cyclodiphosphate synthase
MSGPVAAVLVAAGQGRRFGGEKLWLDFWGRPVWRWSLDTLLSVPDLSLLVLVVPAADVNRFREALPEHAGDRVRVVAGGEERTNSVVAGITALTVAGVEDDTPILVHDAARPAATPELMVRVVAAVRTGTGAVPLVPIADSLKTVDANRMVSGSVDRDAVLAAQTPQGGTLRQVRAAMEETHAWGRVATDEASAMAAGALLRAALAGWAAPAGPPVSLAEGARAGIGFDAHRLEGGRPMRLGGLEWPGEAGGLAGHSDGDAALHAVIDALLGAAGLGDVGTLYPPDDERWAGADSAELLRGAVERLAASGWRPANVDLVIAARRPAIAPRRDEIIARVAALCGLEPAAVSVKGTTSDGLGFAGAEGVAAFAVATVVGAGG